MESNFNNVNFNFDFIDQGDTQCFICNHCSYKTTKIRKLYLHNSTKHTIFNLICDICEYKTFKKADMNDHLKHTHGGFTYDCKRCSIKFGLKTLLKEHIKLNHRSSRQAVTCPNCGKHIYNTSRLKAHIRVKHEQNFFKCHLCEAKFSRKSVLNDHIEDCHGHGDEFFDCHNCSEKFLTNNLLKRHTIKEHPEKYFIYCSHCPKMVSQKRKYHMAEHKKKVHQGVSSSGVIGMKNFTEPNHFQEHLKKENQMTYHEKQVHQTVSFPCNKCMKTFTRPDRLQEHLNFEHEGKSLDCQHCAKKFPRKDLLKDHIRGFHLGGYKCQQCSSTFTRKCRLRDHINTDHDKKYYQCQYCERKFKRGDALKPHIKRNHEDIIKLKIFLDSYFPCTKCKASFRDEVSLKSHFHEIHVLSVIHSEQLTILYEKETNVIEERNNKKEKCENMKWENGMISGWEQNESYQIPNSEQEFHTMETQPIALNMDSIHRSQNVSDLLEESCELLSNITSDFISKKAKPFGNVVKTEELQNSYGIDNVKTDKSSLNILRQQNYFKDSVKEEENILTSMTTLFIKENMDGGGKYEKKKPNPSKIVIIKPKKQSIIEIQRHDLKKKIKAIEFSLKGTDLVEFRKIVKNNSHTNNFKLIVNKFRLKLKDKLNRNDKIL